MERNIMRPFIINEEITSKLKALAEHAEKNPFSLDDLLDIINGQAKMAGDYDEFTANLPFGYRLVYSVEEHPNGNFRHLSMSVDTDGKLPNDIIVRECMSMLGFKNQLENCFVSLEDISPKRQAVNVMEAI